MTDSSRLVTVMRRCSLPDKVLHCYAQVFLHFGDNYTAYFHAVVSGWCANNIRYG